MAKSKSPKPTASSDAIPDWSYWGNLSTTNLRSALQLSLGLDPNKHTPALEPKEELRVLYWNRLGVAKNHAPGADWVVGRVVREDGDIHPEFTEVYLKKFADWIVNDTTLEPFPNEFRRLTESGKKKIIQQPQNEVVPPTKPRYLLLNGDNKSEFFFAHQPLEVLEDLLRHYGGNKAKAGKVHGIERRHLGLVIRNLRSGRPPWSEK